MTVGPIPANPLPDVPGSDAIDVPNSVAPGAPSSVASGAPSGPADNHDPAQLFSGLVQALAQGDGALSSAQTAENAFAAGHGDLQTMVFERARADALLQVATTAASRVTQALGTISQMQV